MLNLYGSLEEGVRLAGTSSSSWMRGNGWGAFQQAIQNLSASDAKLLADILREKLTSPEM